MRMLSQSNQDNMFQFNGLPNLCRNVSLEREANFAFGEQIHVSLCEHCHQMPLQHFVDLSTESRGLIKRVYFAISSTSQPNFPIHRLPLKH